MTVTCGPLTVADLIKVLEKCQQDAPVHIPDRNEAHKDAEPCTHVIIRRDYSVELHPCEPPEFLCPPTNPDRVWAHNLTEVGGVLVFYETNYFPAEEP